MKQLQLPGMELPKMYNLWREDQHTLWYLTEKNGSMPPVRTVNYSRLIAADLVIQTDKAVQLTRDGWAVIEAEIKRSLGTTFICRTRS